MIVYNITIKVEQEIERQWLAWLKEKYIPEILATQQFEAHKLFTLLNVDETDGVTYVLQFFAENLHRLNVFENKHAAELHAKFFSEWGEQCIYFESIMQAVQ